jgi:arginine N-succinyltransferase
MLIIRPIRSDDFAALKELAQAAGPGFTSLALGEAALKDRLENSIASFAADLAAPGGEVYLMMLADADTGKVEGVGGIKAQVGVRVPFFSFRCTTLAQCSSAVDRRFDMDALIAVNEVAGATEVGTLFVNPGARGGGAGRLIAKSRYLLMAAAPQRFGAQVIAELRGVVDAKGNSPFWEAVGRPFFRMDFNDADRLSAMDNQFISDLLPTHPIYLDLLPEAARAVVGVAHPEGEAARKLLEAEGFRHRGLIDVFDAGPLMTALKERIRTFRKSRRVKVRLGAPAKTPPVDAVVATERLPDYRAANAKLALDGGSARLDDDVARALDVTSGDTVRIWTPT